MYITVKFSIYFLITILSLEVLGSHHNVNNDKTTNKQHAGEQSHAMPIPMFYLVPMVPMFGFGYPLTYGCSKPCERANSQCYGTHHSCCKQEQGTSDTTEHTTPDETTETPPSTGAIKTTPVIPSTGATSKNTDWNTPGRSTAEATSRKRTTETSTSQKWKYCPPLVIPSNGSYSPSTCTTNYHPVGTICTLHCNHGFQLVGKDTSKCLSSLVWTEVSKCLPSTDTVNVLISTIKMYLPVNLMFLLDESGSIGRNRFEEELEFVRQIATMFPINSTQLAGLVLFSSNSRTNIPLNQYNNSCDFLFAVDKVVYRGGGTNIEKGLNTARNEIQLHGGNRNTLLFLLTDGYGCCQPHVPAAQLKARNTTIIGIGIGSFNKHKLNQVVSTDSTGRSLVFGLENFGAFTEVVQYLSSVLAHNNTACGGFPQCKPLPHPRIGSYVSSHCANEPSLLRTKCVINCGNDLLVGDSNTTMCYRHKNGSSLWKSIPKCQTISELLNILRQSKASNVIYLVQQGYQKEHLEAVKRMIYQLVTLLPVTPVRHSSVITCGYPISTEVNLLETNSSCEFLWEVDNIIFRYGYDIFNGIKRAKEEIALRGHGNSSLIFIFGFSFNGYISNYWQKLLWTKGTEVITFCTQCWQKKLDELATTDSEGRKWTFNPKDIATLNKLASKFESSQQKNISCVYPKCSPLPVQDGALYNSSLCSVEEQETRTKCNLTCNYSEVYAPRSTICGRSGNWTSIPRCLEPEEVADEIKQIIKLKDPQNLIFLLDESWYTKSPLFQKSLDFVRHVVTAFPISEGRSAAFFTPGRINHESRIYLKETNNSCEFLYALTGLRKEFSSRNRFEQSLKAVKKELEVKNGNSILFILHPVRNMYQVPLSVDDLTDELKKIGVTVIIINEHHPYEEMLHTAASISPDDRRFFYSVSNISLVNISQHILKGSKKLNESNCPGYRFCKALPTLLNGQYEPNMCNSNNIHGLAVCRAKCHSGYLPLGRKSVCLKDGFWSEYPSCIDARGFKKRIGAVLQPDQPSNIIFLIQKSSNVNHKKVTYQFIQNTVQLFPIPRVHQASIITFHYSATTEIKLQRGRKPCELLSDIEDINFHGYGNNLQSGLLQAYKEIQASKTGNSSIVVIVAWEWKKARWYQNPYSAAKRLKDSGAKIFMFCEWCDENAVTFVSNDSDGRSSFSGFETTSQFSEMVSDLGKLSRNSSCGTMYSSCGGNFNDTQGWFKSPGYPAYIGKLNCDYHIRAAPQSYVFLYFHVFHISYSSRLTVYQGSKSSHPRLGSFSYRNIPKVVHSIGPMFLTFYNNWYTNYYRGFKLSYIVRDYWGPCGDIQEGVAGDIKSPRYPKQYPNNVSCEWVIHVSPGNKISLFTTKQSIDIESTTGCVNDSLELFQMITGNWVPFGKHCGKKILLPVTVNSTSVKVAFKTNLAVSKSGFHLNWKVNCDADFYAAEGNITSPGYPKQNGRSVNCNYRIHAPANKHIILEFLDFNLQNCYHCYCSSVKIFVDGKLNGNSWGYCSSYKPPRLLAHKSIEIQYQLRYSSNYRGFKAYYLLQDSSSTVGMSTTTY